MYVNNQKPPLNQLTNPLNFGDFENNTTQKHSRDKEREREKDRRR
jgi:hypothetical protein